MNKIKSQRIFIIALVLLNLVLLTFLYLGRHKGYNPNGPKKIVIDRLGFDDQQVVVYEALIEVHQKNMHAQKDEIGDKREELYTLLKTGSRDKEEILLDEIAALQRGLEDMNYKHFHDVKEICKGEQINKFNELVEELPLIFKMRLPKRK